MTLDDDLHDGWLRRELRDLTDNIGYVVGFTGALYLFIFSSLSFLNVRVAGPRFLREKLAP